MSNDASVPQTHLRELAIARLRRRRDFFMHATAYVVINLALSAVWLLTTPDGFYWPMFPLLGWGIGIIFHGIDTFLPAAPAEEKVEREMRRLAQR
jgi:hypothetical protein